MALDLKKLEEKFNNIFAKETERSFNEWVQSKLEEAAAESPVEAAEDVGTAAVNYVTEKHHKQAGENWYEEDEAEKQSFIAGATFGMGLKEKEIERLKELLYKVVTMTHSECHPEYKKEVWDQFCKQNNIEP